MAARGTFASNASPHASVNSSRLGKSSTTADPRGAGSDVGGSDGRGSDDRGSDGGGVLTAALTQELAGGICRSRALRRCGGTAPGRRAHTACGERRLEAFDPLEQRRGRRVRLRVGQSHERRFEHDALVHCLDHGGESLTEHLDRSSDHRPVEPLDEQLDSLAVSIGQMVERSLHRAQEHIAQANHELLREQSRVPTRVDAFGHRHQDATGVTIAEAFDDVVDGDLDLGDTTGGDHLLEGGHRVTGGSAPRPDGEVDRVGRDVESGVVDDVPEIVLQRRGGKKVELEVLRATANRLDHLLGIGRGQHEHHAGRRFLQGLQQRRGCRVGQHVDLVEDVELGPSRCARTPPAR